MEFRKESENKQIKIIAVQENIVSNVSVVVIFFLFLYNRDVAKEVSIRINSHVPTDSYSGTAGI